MTGYNSLIGFILPLFIVHYLFKWHSGIDFIVAEWSAGLQASQKANKLSEKVIDMEKDKYRLELRPIVSQHFFKIFIN